MTVETGSTWQVGIEVGGLTAEGSPQWLLRTFSDMPKLFTMAVAMRVACWKSLEAPAMKGQLFEPIHAPIKVTVITALYPIHVQLQQPQYYSLAQPSNL